MRSIIVLIALLCATTTLAFGPESKLRRAILADDNESVRQILRTSLISYQMPTLQSWIDFAAEHDRMKALVTLLYEEGFLENREPIMTTALRLRETRAMRRLAKKKMLVDMRDANGWTPLHYACENGLVFEANLLMESGADVNAFTPETRYRPVHLAASAGNATLLRMLRKRGARMNVLTADRRNAGFFAAASGCDECLRVLKDSRVDLLKLDIFGMSLTDFYEITSQFIDETRLTPQRSKAILALISPRKQ